MKKSKCIDTHTHTQFWDEKHFKELDSSIHLISLDTFMKTPEAVKLHLEKDNITYAYGLQPYTDYKPLELEKYLVDLERKAKAGKISLLGELGLNSFDQKEIVLLQEQLKIAKKYELPVIVHTPIRNKLSVCKRSYDLLTSIGIESSKVIIDHADQDILDWHNPEYFVGITIQGKHGKLSMNQAINLVLGNPRMADKFVVNSDYSNLPLRKQSIEEVNIVKDFKHRLSKIDSSLAERICYENPIRFLGEKYGNKKS